MKTSSVFDELSYAVTTDRLRLMGHNYTQVFQAASELSPD
jgi:hypothetical protein